MRRTFVLAAVAAVAALAAIAYSSGWMSGANANSPCVAQSFEGSRFTVCAYDVRRHEIELAWGDSSGAPYRSFENYERERGSARVRFAMNAGIFEPNVKPTGLFRNNGVTMTALNTATGDGNFYKRPNGVFFGDDHAVGLATTDAFVSHSPTLFATQSGPMLVIHGRIHPEFDRYGVMGKTRNGVGVRDPQTAYFVISEDEVSLAKIARLFRDVLGCRDALYLDGGISSLWVPGDGRRDSHSLLGPMIIVRDRAPRRP